MRHGPNYQHGYSLSKIYGVLHSMKKRCYTVNDKAYKSYGGRGITICDEWKNSPRAFCEWALANGWKQGLHIDRKNVDGNYEPSNCRFVTPRVNSLNKRNSSKFPGTSFHKPSKQWRARITINNKRYHLGLFNTPEEATRCYTRTAEAFCG